MSFFLRFSLKGSRFLFQPGYGSWAAVLLASGILSTASPVLAQDGTPIHIDASAPYTEPSPALYDEGAAKSPSGVVLGINSRYLTFDGKPWLPAMGEFHFSRYPRDQWEPEILKMKAAGVKIVATYVIWIHHEEIKGQFDWSGQHDLRAFAQLCAKHHLLMVARIGPWVHGEVRNGGFPDWVVQQGPTRTNDPTYLASVRSWYDQIGTQLKGLLWKDGGPVIGVQLENEYSKRGPGAGEEHILELKKIAIESGLDVPLYLVTGWDNAVVPRRAVIPVYGGGYPDAPWDSSIAKLPPPEVYSFRFHSRVKANDAQSAPANQHPAPDSLPYLTAEIGGGIEDTYHRRPVIVADDIGAMFPVMLGSGVNLYGTYMFHGGENPDGKQSTLQESQDTGYPNDLPIKSYDFQAPLGEFGEERASFRKIKVFQYFLNDFGSDLAPMIVHAPDTVPRNSADLTAPRASVRSNGNSGFLFFNNYVRGYSMPARHATQFFVRLPGGTLAIPRQPVDLPSGAYFILPFNFHIAGINLRYSTAQVFARLKSGNVTTLYFEAIPGIPVELALDVHDVARINSPGETERASDAIYVSHIKPGIDSQTEVVSRSGETIRMVVLTAEEAEDAWKVRFDGSDHLLITAQDFFADPDANPQRIWLRSIGSPRFDLAITPPLATAPDSSLPLTRVASGKFANHFLAEARTRNVELTVRKLQPAGVTPPIKLGPALDWRPVGVAQAPAAGNLPQAARWSINVPPGSMDGLNELFLEVNYQGDLARMYADHRLLTDNFFNGLPWSVGLSRFLDARGSGNFELDVLPLRKDAPVYFEIPGRLEFPASGQVANLQSTKLVPEYQLQISVPGECASDSKTSDSTSAVPASPAQNCYRTSR
jgi:beta-galactosidase